MPDPPDVVLKIKVFRDAGRQTFLGGTVDIRLKHTRLASELRELRAVDASKEIAVAGLRRGPEGVYEVAVTRSDPWMRKVQVVSIPASGIATLDFDFGQDDDGGDHGGGGEEPFEVRGLVIDDRRVAARGVRVEALDHNLDGTTPLGSASTDDAGRYSIRYRPRGKRRADLQVRTLGVESQVIYDAEPLEVIDLMVPTKDVPRATEYERLLAALRLHLGTTRLDELSAEGVGYLANKSGWDPRAVAMAAQAARLAGSTRIPAAHYYALFRSGAPNDELSLSRLSSAYVERALRSAIADKVIPGDAAIDATLAAFREQSAPLLATIKPAGAVSSLGEMLDVRLDGARKSKFVDLYQTHGHEPAALWASLAQNGFAPETIRDLQTDGKLGYLTQHNAPLVSRLRQNAEITEAADLARAGLYKTAAWTDLIGDDVPEGITADAYAAGLAAQVNLSFPTLVAAEMVSRNEVLLPTGSAPEVARFLGGHPDRTLGVEPVKTWTGYPSLSPDDQAGARLVERMYQISPSNESMAALSKLGLHSAYQVVSHAPETFLTRYGGEFPSREEARLVYSKAQEVHSTALGVATTYLTSRVAPNVYSITGDLEKHLPDWIGGAGAPVPGAPTLEELFDNLDYCACDHCKSVLSPAAYLVELLQFIDLDPSALKGGQNPIAVLRGRRPDIERLLLTCENTNVALPYVDLVNEILEFYVVHGGIATFPGHDTAEDSDSADLLADPQFVEDTAYDATKDAVYPWSLPFDMPLAAMRLILESCGTSLAESLRRLGDSAGARRELLGLNAREYSILTNIAFRDLPVYFGLPAATTLDALNDEIADGKSFSRVTGISYEELVALLKTELVNPGVVLVPSLATLGLGLDQIQAWYEGGLTDAALLALLPPGLDTAEYGGNVLAWLTSHRDLIMHLITLTDVGDPDHPAECNFAEVELRFALPDMTANRLTPIAYHKLLRFIRLWKKLGWSIELTDQVVTTFLPTPSQELTEANVDAAFTGLLARIANFKLLLETMSVSSKNLATWLGVWDDAADLAVRQERLAGLLRIGITDMLDLAGIAGVDPLADDLEADAPSLLRFIELWQELKAIGLKVVDLNYLLRHQDASGKLTPTETSLLRGLKALRDGLTAVEAEVSIAPGNADLAFAKAKMALVYDPTVVNWFFALIGDTTTYSAPLLMVEEVLPAPLTAVDARLTYDPFKKLLGFSGIVTASVQAALGMAADGLELTDMAVVATPPDLSTFVTTFKASVQDLLDAGERDLQDLNLEYPELKLVYDAVQAAADPAAKATALIDGVLPGLRRKLETVALRGTLGALLQSDPGVVDALSGDPVVLHADGDATRGVLTDFERLQTAVTFDTNQDYRFYLDPPATDDYILYVAAPPGSTITLTLGETPVIPATAVGAGGEVKTNLPIALTAGALVLGQLTLAGLPADATAELRWRTKGMAKTAVPGARVYAEAQAIAARASLIRLQKAASLRRLLALTPRELAYFAGTHPETVGVLNDLYTGGLPVPDLQALWDRVALLVWFAGLKRENEPDENTWLGLLEQPDLSTAQGDLLILGVNGWQAADLTEVLDHFTLAQADLSQLGNLRTVKRVMDWVVAADYPAADLLDWSSAAPDAALLSKAKTAIRARLEDAPWRETLQSVNDALRNQRRDALVSYILCHRKPAADIDTADRLYEHFLIDVQMDACMLTSRIRAALSAVQLFITRCFMNLEPAVTPAALRADRWTYMKRYRVWEANRKIFLYPENWLEPELRDNKSLFFRELEAELLKSDITAELAEDAYLSYLKKLDDVARLEIVGTALEERQPGDQTDDVLHVFGRTNGDTRQYYYRRYEGGYWLPWEKVSLNIQGNHVLPVVWKGRLFVFWLNASDKAQGAADKALENMRTETTWTGNALKTAEITVGWGEYYKGKWSSPKSSELKDPLRISGLPVFEPRRIVVGARTDKPDEKVSERLIFDLAYLHEGHQKWFRLTFTSKNAPPVIEEQSDLTLFFNVELFNYNLFWEPQIQGRLDANSLRVPGKVLNVSIQQPAHAVATSVGENLLTKTGLLHSGYYVRPLLQLVENQWEAPFFYYDEHSTFFVAANEKVRLVYDYNGYFAEIPPYLPDEVFIPPLYEVPVPDPIGPLVSPEGPWFERLGPVVVRLGEGLGGRINTKAQTVLPNGSQFNYWGVAFGAHGIVKGEQ